MPNINTDISIWNIKNTVIQRRKFGWIVHSLRKPSDKKWVGALVFNPQKTRLLVVLETLVDVQHWTKLTNSMKQKALQELTTVAATGSR